MDALTQISRSIITTVKDLTDNTHLRELDKMPGLALPGRTYTNCHSKSQDTAFSSEEWERGCLWHSEWERGQIQHSGVGRGSLQHRGEGQPSAKGSGRGGSYQYGGVGEGEPSAKWSGRGGSLQDSGEWAGVLTGRHNGNYYKCVQGLLTSLCSIVSIFPQVHIHINVSVRISVRSEDS